MADFVQHYGVLRWSVVAAFLVAAAVVGVRLWQPVLSASGRAEVNAEPRQADSVDRPIACQESDAAHLLMCLVMLAMLVFPAGASPHAVNGVLTAMAVVFAALLISRIAQRPTEGRLPPAERIVVLGYHVVAAAAMLYAMSGHAMGARGGGPAPIPALALAALFLADALAILLAASTGRRYRWLAHALATPGPSLALIPHVVMDIGTAYMLIAAVSG
ncbi:DUF5134 domain-containing protein [Nocardia sp. NPDC052566]|uniref:DUF5134 domain-containing protein n=1 Tax=Nocardia sp. NPDC052566 TaxID=3364330 RepID=UPI0037C5B35C